MSDIRTSIRKNSRSLPVTLALAITSWLVVMIIFFNIIGVKSTQFYSLADRMSVDVHYIDGSEKHFDDGKFGTIKKGEILDVYIDIPDDLDIFGAELFLPLYNSSLKAYSGDMLLYEENSSGNLSSHYGNKIYEIPLPGDYESADIRLEITSIQGMPHSDLRDIGIVSASGGWKRILDGSNTLIFLISIALMVLSLISIFYFTIRSIAQRRLQIGLPVALFEFFIVAWFFGSMRMFYLISSSTLFCSKIEYYSLYLAPIPLAFFIHTQVSKKMFKIGISAVASIYILFYLVSTIIELSPINMNYSDLLSTMHLLAGIMIVLLVVALFAGIGKENNRNINILRYGILISMLCGLMELIRFNYTKYIIDGSWVATHGASAIAILVIAASLVIYLISISADEYTARIEQEQLMILAYKDALTDMPNRRDCYRQIEQMEKKNIREYSMIFFDLNNLKIANDKFGHEMGDKLLQTMADHMKMHFSEDGFCARWGGDEFVACVFGAEDVASMHLDSFMEDLKKEDESGTFPFKVSAAVGQIRSEDGAPVDPLLAIRQADALMYENKKKMKACREQQGM